MGYIVGSFSRVHNFGVGGNISVTIASAGAIGEVFVALASNGAGAGNMVSVSSPNISWQLAERFDHDDNSQGFEAWVGRVTSAFGANTESVTMALLSVTSYREVVVAGWAPESGYEFPSSGYFVDGASVTYAANSNPTSTDAYSATPALGGVTAKYLLIGLLATESATLNAGNVSPGTGYVERQEWELFDAAGCYGNLFDRIYDGNVNQAVLGTVNANANYMTSLCGIALKLVPLGGGPAQVYAYPISDMATGAWTPTPGSPATLFDKVDEAAASDTDYISTFTPNSECELALGALTDPNSDLNHGLTIRASDTGSRTLTVTLVEGTTTIASWTQALTSVLTDYTFSLTGPQAASITNYGNLRVRLKVT